MHSTSSIENDVQISGLILCIFIAGETPRNALFCTERRLVTRTVARGNGDRDVSDSTAR